jgi:hypothetical protein
LTKWAGIFSAYKEVLIDHIHKRKVVKNTVLRNHNWLQLRIESFANYAKPILQFSEYIIAIYG